MTGKAALRQSGTGQSPGDGLELVYLDVVRINPYEHNPRRAPNTEFDRIKASIRVDGLGQPLVVTQRPGESDYLVHAGGNTRLRILKELFGETDDPRFGTVACVVRRWTREADVLLAHLKENDLRGELTFLDKALAVADAKRLLEEDGTAEFTQARLAEVLTRSGYGLSQGAHFPDDLRGRAAATVVAADLGEWHRPAPGRQDPGAGPRSPGPVAGAPRRYRG